MLDAVGLLGADDRARSHAAAARCAARRPLFGDPPARIHQSQEKGFEHIVFFSERCVEHAGRRPPPPLTWADTCACYTAQRPDRVGLPRCTVSPPHRCRSPGCGRRDATFCSLYGGRGGARNTVTEWWLRGGWGVVASLLCVHSIIDRYLNKRQCRPHPPLSTPSDKRRQ